MLNMIDKTINTYFWVVTNVSVRITKQMELLMNEEVELTYFLLGYLTLYPVMKLIVQ